jgi:hypothetical protein
VCFFFFFSLACLRFVVAGVTATKRKPSSFSFSIPRCCCCCFHFYIEDDNDYDDEEEDSMTKKMKKRKSFSSSSSLSFFFSRACFLPLSSLSLSLFVSCALRVVQKK